MSNKQQLERTTQQINSAFAKTTNNVFDSVASIFVKDDVFLLLESLRKEINDAISVSDIEDCTQQSIDIKEVIKRAINQIDFKDYVEVDYDNATFEIQYGNTIELTDVDFNFDEDTIAEHIIDHFEKAQQEITDCK